MSNSYPFINYSSYTPRCVADSPAHQAKLGAGYYGNLTNLSTTDDITVHCPIIKTTSGPTTSNDQFYSAEIPVTTTGAWVSCEVDVNVANVQSFDHQNIREYWYDGRDSNGVITVGPQDYGTTGNRYWNAGSTEAGSDWFFLDLVCVLPPGTGLGVPPMTGTSQYTIKEKGSAQTHRIYGASSCLPSSEAATNHNWTFVWDPWYPTDPWWGWGRGGYIYGNQDPTGPLKFNCAVPNGLKLEVAVGGTIGTVGGSTNNTLGCRLDNTDLTTLTWWAEVQNPSFPVQILPRLDLGQSAINIPSTGTHVLTCGYKLAGNGDGNLVSYRAMPQ